MCVSFVDCDTQDDEAVQCAVTAQLAVEPDTALAGDADADAHVASVHDAISDSWKMESLYPAPALFQPVQYPSMHIFVSYY